MLGSSTMAPIYQLKVFGLFYFSVLFLINNKNQEATRFQTSLNFSKNYLAP